LTGVLYYGSKDTKQDEGREELHFQDKDDLIAAIKLCVLRSSFCANTQRAELLMLHKLGVSFTKLNGNLIFKLKGGL
jgi:hypothetical protein